MKNALKISIIVLAVLLCAIMLVSGIIFASRGFGKYVARLEKAGYNVAVYDGEKLEIEQEKFEIKGYEIKSYAVATKTENSSLSVATVIKFKSSSQAQGYVKNELGGTSAVRKGAVVIIGSENAKNTALGK